MKIIKLILALMFLIVLSGFVSAVDGSCKINVGSNSKTVNVREGVPQTEIISWSEKVEAGNKIKLEIKNCNNIDLVRVYFDAEGDKDESSKKSCL